MTPIAALQSIDAALLLAIANAAAAAGLVPLAIAVTLLGDPPVRLAVAGIVIAVLLWRRAWRAAAGLVATVAGGGAIVSLAKHAFDRARPMLLPQLDHVTNASMPSGHAANGTMIWLGCALAIGTLVAPRTRRGLIAAALAIGFAIGVSRLALAVHWPSDVIAGWAIGIVWAVLCARIAARFGAAPLSPRA